MRPKIIVPPGTRSGRLVVICEAERAVDSRGRLVSRRRLLCRCDCGTERAILLQSITKPRPVQSCGCVGIERITNHGQSKHRLFGVWNSMNGRCSNPSQENYYLYGGRSIGVCDEWTESPKAFYGWAMSHGWKPGLQIDRIANDGDYTPENCRFVTAKENCRNKRTNRMLTLNGETMCLKDWVLSIGLSQGCIDGRLKRGWSIERALTTPADNKDKKSDQLITFTGKALLVSEWAERRGFTYKTVRDRLQRGWSVEKALTTPLGKYCYHGIPPTWPVVGA